MATGWYIWILRNSKIWLPFCLLLSCSRGEKPSVNQHLDVSALRQASLVCRAGNGFFSGFFRRYGSQAQRYSHIGILSIEQGQAFVYHAEASELTGVGSVRREPLSIFLDGIKTYAFYDMPYDSSAKENILDTVKAYHHRHTPFDLNFDNANDKEVYCTELIAVAINKVMKQAVILPSVHLHDRVLYGLDDVRVGAQRYAPKKAVP